VNPAVTRRCEHGGATHLDETRTMTYHDAP
jgi:hypothetical protein